MALRVKVDQAVCQGHGLCYYASERLFALDDGDGRARVLLDPVPEDLREAARAAAAGCPEQAITLSED
jgi:ferredoxin